MRTIGRSMAALAVAAGVWAAGTVKAGDPVVGAQPRKPGTDAELRYWLQNMVWGFGFETDEIQAAAGLSAEVIQGEFDRIAKTGWTEDKWEEAPRWSKAGEDYR